MIRAGARHPMVDVALMRRLLEAVPKSARLILLGDRHQLASVEAGSVLADICGTEKHPGYAAPLSAGVSGSCLADGFLPSLRVGCSTMVMLRPS